MKKNDFFKEKGKEAGKYLEHADTEWFRYKFARQFVGNMYDLYNQRFLELSNEEEWQYKVNNPRVIKPRSEALDFLKKMCKSSGVTIDCVKDYIIFIYNGRPIEVKNR